MSKVKDNYQRPALMTQANSSLPLGVSKLPRIVIIGNSYNIKLFFVVNFLLL